MDQDILKENNITWLIQIILYRIELGCFNMRINKT